MPKLNSGAVLYDLPSPYVPHKCGLLHLPRFIAKIKKHLKGELPKEYQRNFTRGFDGFLCLHLGIDPQSVIEIVKTSTTDKEIDHKLAAIFPSDLKVHVWNRKLVQMGMSEMGKKVLEEQRQSVGIPDRTDIISFADMIDIDEGRIE